MNMLDLFGSQVAAGMMPQPTPAFPCLFNYTDDCRDYTCSGYECYIFECYVDYECSGYFSCWNMGGGDDFTCVAAYVHSNCGGTPIPSIPCPGT